MKAYRVPDRDTSPSDAMIDFLGLNTRDWEGDSEGIILHVNDAANDESIQTAFIGDWIVEIGGVYSVAKHEEMVKNYPDLIEEDSIFCARTEHKP